VLVKVDEIPDGYGGTRTVVTQQCDGPDCENTIRSNEERFAEWGSMLGFVNILDVDGFDERPSSGNWCSVPCLKAWAAVL
jgi:hypothetical protein